MLLLFSIYLSNLNLNFKMLSYNLPPKLLFFFALAMLLARKSIQQMPNTAKTHAEFDYFKLANELVDKASKMENADLEIGGWKKHAALGTLCDANFDKFELKMDENFGKLRKNFCELMRKDLSNENLLKIFVNDKEAFGDLIGFVVSNDKPFIGIKIILQKIKNSSILSNKNKENFKTMFEHLNAGTAIIAQIIKSKSFTTPITALMATNGRRRKRMDNNQNNNNDDDDDIHININELDGHDDNVNERLAQPRQIHGRRRRVANQNNNNNDDDDDIHININELDGHDSFNERVTHQRQIHGRRRVANQNNNNDDDIHININELDGHERFNESVAQPRQIHGRRRVANDDNIGRHFECICIVIVAVYWSFQIIPDLLASGLQAWFVWLSLITGVFEFVLHIVISCFFAFFLE